MTDEPKLLLRLEIRSATRNRFHQTMGELRSMAAQMAAQGHTADEEQYFRDLVYEYFYVERQETIRLFGVQQASALLDIFRLNRDLDCFSVNKDEQILEDDGDSTSTG